MEYTAKVFKKDARCKRGEKVVTEFSKIADAEEQVMESCTKDFPAPTYRVEVHQTYVTRKNIMSGKEYQERYDTPCHMSPSCESYWTM